MSPCKLLIALCVCSFADLAHSGEESEAAIELTFEQLDFDPPEKFERMHVPKQIDAADGKRVRVEGFFWPSFQQKGIRQFVLQKNVQMRYDSSLPADEIIRVNVKEGWGATFSTRPTIIEGTFAIDPVRGETKYVVLYHITDATILSPGGNVLIERIEDDEEKQSPP